MRFITLIFKNPFRNKTRSALSIIGIAIGIATIIALGLITAGMEDSVQTSLNGAGAEITVTNSTTIGEDTNMIASEIADDVKNISGVIDSAGQLSVSEMTSNKDKMDNRFSGTTIIGMQPEKLNLVGITDVEGKIYDKNSSEIIVGAQYAKMNNVSIGDNITFHDHRFTVCGIYETGSIFTDGGIYVSLDTLQDLVETQKYSAVLVKTGENVNDTQISNEIEKRNENLTTLTSEEMTSMADEVLGKLNTASFAVSALAIVVGAIGIINTMVMTVYERTKEIGVLKSVGWKPRRILTMILGETLVLTTLSGIIGTIFGVLICEIGVRAINVDNFSLGYEPKTFILAFGITLIVGIIGGIYPARKASKLPPTEALRYE